MTQMDIPYRYRSRVFHIVDGDTMDLIVDLGMYTTREIRIRLFGVDTPEVRGPEREEGLLATKFVVDWIERAQEDPDEGWPLVIDTHMDSKGKYGRWLATIYDKSGYSLADALLAAGLAQKI